MTMNAMSTMSGTSATSIHGADDTASAYGHATRAQALDVARTFEAIFVQEVVAGMRKNADAMGGEGLFGSGPGSDTYAQWFDSHMSTQLADSGQVGIAKALMQEFARLKQVPGEDPADARRDR